MKKEALLKKIILTCLFVGASCCAVRAADQTVNVGITAGTGIATPDEVTLSKGDHLTVQGLVTPDIGYSFKSIEAVLKDNYSSDLFFPVLQQPKNTTVTDANFSFVFTAESEGDTSLSFKAIYSQNGSTETKDNLTPIKVHVK